ncbi:MAG: O-methyltransferase [Gemmatimonadaceae bacterium]
MTDTKWAEVDEYLNALHIGRDVALDDAAEATVAAGLPPIAVTPNQGKLLHILARMQRARSILEVGTLGGYSTIWLARGLEPGGKVVTLELDQKHADVASSSIAKAGLSDSVAIHVGRAIDTLPQLEHSGDVPFDLIFIDADKKSIPQYFEWALKMSRPGTLILVDNVVRAGRVVDADSADADIQGIRTFNEKVAREPRVTVTTLQTVGSKGYDGLAFVLVNG